LRAAPSVAAALMAIMLTAITGAAQAG
jgi:hypothetical protein